MKIFFKIIFLVLILFFVEITISFSDRVNKNPIRTDDNISFALTLDNSDSEFENTTVIDQHFISFINKYGIKGASIALSRNEKLLYAKGFGYANMETGERVQPGHLFRIASVSKLITAVAILKLYEEGKLSLDDPVFGYNGALPFLNYYEYADQRVEQITIRHLLNHTAGWSRHRGDPMFNPLYIARKYNQSGPADIDLIIRFALERKLDYDPGKVYSYSNLGYGILGKIISLKTGMSYEDYVILNILKPLGIHDFHIGKSFYHQKLPNEVRYYDRPGSSLCLAVDGSDILVPKPYGGNNMELLAAAGGWIASAPELIKFINAIDGSDIIYDILKKETIDMMTNKGIAGKGLFGWRGVDRSGTVWRTGTLSGSTAMIMKQSNGNTWVVLLNGSAHKRNSIHNRIAATMFSAQRKIKEWPDVDLFAQNKNINILSGMHN